jgi:transposase
MKRYRPEQVVEKLRQADVELGKGLSVKQVCRAIEVSEPTYYHVSFRWPAKQRLM